MEKGTKVYITTRTDSWMTPEERQQALLPGVVVRSNRYRVDVQTEEGVIGTIPKYVVTQDKEQRDVTLKQWAKEYLPILCPSQISRSRR